MLVLYLYLGGRSLICIHQGAQVWVQTLDLCTYHGHIIRIEACTYMLSGTSSKLVLCWCSLLVFLLCALGHGYIECMRPNVMTHQW
jgi:hypothetical protein